MDDLILIKPTIEYEKELVTFRNSFINRGEVIQGGGDIENFESISKWIEKNNMMEKKETCPEDKVTATQYMLLRKNDRKVLGLINFRHYLNDYLKNYGGHIGYSIVHDERGKKYGKKQLILCLEKAKEKGLEKVLLTCDKNNISSKLTIESVGGIFEKEITQKNGIITLKYWISL